MSQRLRWVVRPGDGASVGDIVARAGAPPDAVRDGRVFVGRRRARSVTDTVRVGDEVFIAPGAEARPVAILLDAEGLVAVDKPADMPTIADHGGARASLVEAAAHTLGVASATLHPTSRLDRGVSGVVVLARTKEARERLSAARDQGSYCRRYVAIASRVPPMDTPDWSFPIGRAADPKLRKVMGSDATAAVTRVRVVARAGEWALLALEPVTGRTHQLRVHAAHVGAPLLGDPAYGGPSRATLASGGVLAFERVALHAARIRLLGKDGRVIEIVSPIPSVLRGWWRSAGGVDAAWEDAMCDPLR